MPTARAQTIRKLASLGCVAALAMAAAVRAAAVQESAASADRRWFYCAIDLHDGDNVTALEQLMTRAAAAGFNGVLLADASRSLADRPSAQHTAHLDHVRRAAAKLQLEIIPAVMPLAHPNLLLAADPNLAEGLPVRDQLLVVHGDSARVDPQPPVQLEGGTFESGGDHHAAGWDAQDLPGRISFLDTEVKHSGKSALRIRDPGTAERHGTNCRVTKTIRVAPFRQYHLSAWIKTRHFEAHSGVRLFATGGDGRLLSHSNLGVQATQDWTQHHVLFNSLANEEVRIDCGVWGGKQGTLWLDDLAIDETAFLNLIRRPGCPLTVSFDGGDRLREGFEFSRLHDPQLGTVALPGGLESFHTAPRIQLKSPAALRDGDRLRASYYHAIRYDERVTCCLSEPRGFELFARQAAAVQRSLEPKRFVVRVDDIRVAGWCTSCYQPKRSSGRLLAESVSRSMEILRQINSGAEILVWSDLFDPAPNALHQLHLVNGSLAGWWEGFSPGVTIVNGNVAGRSKSLPFFTRRGHRQILAGSGASEPIAGWLRDAAVRANICGVLFVPRHGRYDELESFARQAWGTPSSAAGPRPAAR